MFAKRLLQKAMPQHHLQPGRLTPSDLDPYIAVHYGIPSTASIMAFDRIQRLLAIGTLDGRIKVIGGDNIEGLLISPKQLPYKHLEFLYNQGYLVSISNENDIQVWDLEHRSVAYSLQWDTNITAFSIIQGTYFMYIGDDHGSMSVVKYDIEERKLLRLPYHIPSDAITEAAGIALSNHQSIVGVLPQPCTSENRVVIAYENGLIVLWDISDNRVVLVRGHMDLQLKDEETIGSSNGVNNEAQEHSSQSEQEEKVICSLCWASTSVLAVGYIDGDILLWNMSSSQSSKGQKTAMPSNNVVKLQLASGDRRLPVIVTHWSPSMRRHNEQRGHLFIYGGDEIGSEEVLTVLSLEWSSGIESLRCTARVDLALNGSFADMLLIPNVGSLGNTSTAAVFLLTNPGQLHVYDGANISTLSSEKENHTIAEQFPLTVPILIPCMTVSKLTSVPSGGNHLKALSKTASAMKNGASSTLSAGTRWPLTGGVPSPLSFSDDIGVEQMYIAGYQDGSVRIWDATYPVLSHLSVLQAEVPGVKVDGVFASVSALDFCSTTMSLAVGNECGLVHVYKLHGGSDERTFHFVSATKHEVHTLDTGEEFRCIAVFTLTNSPIRTLHFAYCGAKLTVGFECGQIAVLDLASFSVLFQTDCGSSSCVASIAMKIPSHIVSLVNSPKQQQSINLKSDAEDVLFILSRDACIYVIDSVNGTMIGPQPLHPKRESIAISMYVIDADKSTSEVRSEQNSFPLSQDNDLQNGCNQSGVNGADGSKLQEAQQISSSETVYSPDGPPDPLFVLCCEDALRLYSLKSVIEGERNYIHKVNLVKPCCWSTMFKKKDGKAVGLVLLYQTGVLEIRSLPDLEVIGEYSLMSVLRWSFKTNMSKTLSSNDGQIALINGFELALVSLLARENEFRFPDSLPCLHDKVLAAAADAAGNVSSYQRKKQNTAGILGGIIKGFKGEQSRDHTEIVPISTINRKLDGIFSRFPFSDPPTTTVDQDVVELSIDDIEIDETSHVASKTSSHIGKHNRKDEETEREKLFHGATSDMKPRLRTPEEIRAQYRGAADVSSVASHARDKLAERQEKLERIKRNTEELQSGAESFASMANELVKTMEARKWWQK